MTKNENEGFASSKTAYNMRLGESLRRVDLAVK
jgi:hypothetical protein